MKNVKRGSLRRQSTRAHVENLENRQLLSAALSVSSSLLVLNAVKGSTSVTHPLTLTDTGNASLSLGTAAFSITTDSSSPTNDIARFSILNAGAAPASLSPGQSLFSI